MSGVFRGVHLHSTYAPDREARRWAEGLNLNPHQAVFLLGDALGHAKRELEKTPGCRVWTLIPGAEFRSHRDEQKDLWAPEEGNLEGFLEGALEVSGVESLRLEVWPPFDRAAPDLVEAWGQTFRRIFRQTQGSRLTEQRFGPSYWKNTLRNLADWECPCRVVPGDQTILIAASGPSLELCREWMRAQREKFTLWALPSSFEALKTWGLRPDAGIATDGGYYAREHLACLETGVPLLGAVNGAPDPRAISRPTSYFSQATAPERIFLPLFAPDAAEIPPKGTVAVSAVQLALTLTTGPVLVAGMDLGFDRLKPHAAPHTNETFLRPRCHRLNPWDSLAAHRALTQGPVIEGGIRTSPAMLTYAQWLDREDRFPRPVYRLLPTALKWKSMGELSLDQAGAYLSGQTPFQTVLQEGWKRSLRIEKLQTVLAAWGRSLGEKRVEDSLLTEVARTAAAADLGRWQKYHRSDPRGPEAQAAWADLEAAVGRFFAGLEDWAGGLR